MSRLLVIGHRGASGYRPEHTLGSYELGARMGADHLDVDLVSTADGVLVCRHDDEISTTTDVAARPELADRRTTRVVDGVACTGWFTEDLTLAELRTLRAVERLPRLRPASTAHDGLEEVPTFEEVLDLRARLSDELGREVGLCPETKHPTSSAALGLALEEPLLAALDSAGLVGEGSPVLVQSFETASLRALHAACPHLRRPPHPGRAARGRRLGRRPGPRRRAGGARPHPGRPGPPQRPRARRARGRPGRHPLHAAGGERLPPGRAARRDRPGGPRAGAGGAAPAVGAGVDGVSTDVPDLGVESRRRVEAAPAPG